MEQNFVCPINHTTFVDPVIAADGYTYERAAIEQWITANPTDTRSPLTNVVLLHTKLIPNHSLKSCIADWQEGALRNTAALRKRTSTHPNQDEPASGSKRILMDDVRDLGLFLNKVQPLLDRGDLPALLEVMRDVVRGNILIETKMFDTLSALALSDKDSSETVLRTGGIACVVDSMKFYLTSTDPRCPAMYASACHVLVTVTSSLIDYEKRLAYIQTIDSAGGIDAVLDALEKHIKHEQLVKEAIQTLSNIVMTFVDATATVSSSVNILVGAVRSAVSVLIHHNKNSILVNTVLKLLCHLAHYPAGKEEISKSRAVFFVINAARSRQNVVGDTHMAEVFEASCVTIKIFSECKTFTSTPQTEVLDYLCDVFQDIRVRTMHMVRLQISSALPPLQALVSANNQNRGHVNARFTPAVLSSIIKLIFRLRPTDRQQILEDWLAFLNALVLQDTVSADSYDVNFLKGVTDAMKQFKGNLNIQKHGTDLINKYMDCKHHDKYIAIHAADGIEVLTENIKHHIPTIHPQHQSLARTLVHDSCRAIMSLIVSKTSSRIVVEKMLILMAHFGTIGAVVSVINREASTGGALDGSMNIDACAALQLLPHLCHNETKYSTVLALDALKPIFSLVTLFKDVQSVVALCLTTLSRTYGHFKSFTQGRQIGMFPSHVEIILDVMKLHQNAADIQGSACCVLNSYCDNAILNALCSSIDDELRTTLAAFGSVGAVNVVLDAMKRRPEHVLTQYHGCRFISSFLRLMTSLNKKTFGITAVLSLGGLQQVLSLWQQHKSEGNIPNAVCLALTEFCIDNGSQATIIAAGGVGIALSVLQTPDTSYPKLSQAMGLLTSMLADNDDKTKFQSKAVDAIVASGAIKTMVETMATSKTDRKSGKKALVMQVCYVMIALSRDPMPCETFALHGGVQLLLDSIKSHKKTIGQWPNMTMELLYRISRNKALVLTLVAAGGIQTCMDFVDISVDNNNSLNQMSLILHNISQVPASKEFMKEPTLGLIPWVQTVLKDADYLDEEARQRYTNILHVLV